MKRYEEELCKSIFDAYLLKFFNRQEIRWTESESPDFFLELSDRRFAVEVTQLIEPKGVGSSTPMSILGVISSFRRLVDSIKSTATQGGYLNGRYVVSFGELFENFSKIKRQLESALLNYIQRTQALPNAPQQELEDKSGGQRCAIAKVDNLSNEVMMMHSYVLNEDGLPMEICRLINETLLKKTHSLRNVRLPRILLLGDLYTPCSSYDLGNPDIRIQCASSLAASLKTFHAVFVIQDDDKGFTFYPEESNWIRNLFVSAPA